MPVSFLRHAVLAPTILALAACSSTSGGGPAGGAAAGTLYYDASDDGFVHVLSLANGSDQKLFFGGDPYRTKEGTFVYVSEAGLAESADGVQVRTIIPFNPDIAHFDNGFHGPRPSPDGTLIAYNTNDDLVYVCKRADGTIVSRFPEPEGSTVGFDRPTWTPDGRIVVAGEFSNPGLYVSDAAFTTFTRFDPMIDQPKWPSVSPNGDRVAFVSSGHVFTIALDGSNLVQLTNGDHTSSFPDFSPDGTLGAWDAAHFAIVAPAGGIAFDTTTAFPGPDMFYRFNTDQPFSLR